MADIRVPTLGESVSEATVATWFKKVGDAVKVDEMLCELETDKVTLEVPATAAGVLAEIVAEEGETVGVDALLATIDEKAARASRGGPGRRARRGEGAPKPGAAPADDARQGRAHRRRVRPGERAVDRDHGPDPRRERDRGDGRRPGSRRSATRSPRTRCSASSRPTRSRSRCPPPRAARWPRSSPRTAPPSPPAASSAASPAAPPPGAGAAAAARRRRRGRRLRAARRDVEDAPVGQQADGRPRHRPRRGRAGTGNDGRITKDDVLRRAPSSRARAEAPGRPRPPAIPRAPRARRGAAREERVRMTRLRQTIARRLKEAQNTAAMLTTFNEVDMTAVMALRAEYKDAFEKKHGVKLGFMCFFVKAVLPRAEGGPRGQRRDRRHRHRLQEPLRHRRRRRHRQRASSSRWCATPTRCPSPRSRRRSARSAARPATASSRWTRLQGGTFTISNGGVYGSLMSTPILNPPQSGILGMHKIQERPMVVEAARS